MENNYNHNSGVSGGLRDKKSLLIIVAIFLILACVLGVGYKYINKPDPQPKSIQTTSETAPAKKSTEAPYSSKSYKAVDVSTDNPNSSVVSPDTSDSNSNSNTNNDDTRVPPNQTPNN